MGAGGNPSMMNMSPLMPPNQGMNPAGQMPQMGRNESMGHPWWLLAQARQQQQRILAAAAAQRFPAGKL